MMNNIRFVLLKTLTSRKFWAAVAASVPFAVAQDWTNFAYVWMGYAGIQGVVDAADKWGPQPGEPIESTDDAGVS